VNTLVAWCAFGGSWLLVAGPVFQAALELDDLSFRREEVLEALAATPVDPRPSAWWWLLPPVGYVLQRRHTRVARQAAIDAMSREQVERFVDFTDKATGWLFVACGAALLAVAETWALREHYRWPVAVFWVLLVGMPALCAVNTAARMERSRSTLGAKAPAAEPGGSAAE
jgi:hypothetical protein